MNMGDVINLNQVRKARAKAEAVKTADNNRVQHGTPKALKKKSKSEKKKSDQNHEGKRLTEKDD
jgi:hypothetical protein